MPYACPTIAILPSLTIIVVHTHSYTASITVAKAFTAVMAANMLNDVTDDGQVVGVPGEEGLVTFNFMMPQPIPVYLVALAVGDLRCASIGPRSRVWSEPGIIEAATKEFQGVRSGLVVARLSSYPDLTGRCSCVCVFRVVWFFMCGGPLCPPLGGCQITEKYLAAGESLFGKYHWDVYDLLVMPPCFP